MKGKIIVIDDDNDFLSAIQQYLAGRGFEVSAFSKWENTLRESIEQSDVILLDVNLPNLSGYDVLRIVRNVSRTIRVILITGEDSLPRRLKGFSLGTDDYLKKPLYPAEVAARIERYCAEKYSVSTVDTVINQAILNTLTRKELELFSLFLKMPNQVLSSTLLSAHTQLPSSIYTTLFRLKQKLKGTAYKIVSVYGRGWKLVTISENGIIR